MNIPNKAHYRAALAGIYSVERQSRNCIDVIDSRGNSARVTLLLASKQARCSCLGSKLGICEHIVFVGFHLEQGFANRFDSKQLMARLDELVNEEVCPICYQQVIDPSDVFSCIKCCKRFHESCSEAWAKRPTQGRLSCPICRVDWNYTRIKFHEDLHKDKKCRQCSKKVRGKIFRCLSCRDYFLCEDCFGEWTHMEHNCFVMKHKPDSEWQPVPQHRFLYGEKIDLFEMLQEKFNEQHFHGVRKCTICLTKSEGLRLTCGHWLCRGCLYDNVVKDRLCERDNCHCLQGLARLLIEDPANISLLLSNNELT